MNNHRLIELFPSRAYSCVECGLRSLSFDSYRLQFSYIQVDKLSLISSQILLFFNKDIVEYITQKWKNRKKKPSNDDDPKAPSQFFKSVDQDWLHQNVEQFLIERHVPLMGLSAGAVATVIVVLLQVAPRLAPI